MGIYSCESPPTRGCGLKPPIPPVLCACVNVTPYAGVWIETSDLSQYLNIAIVTPYAGVWIETLGLIQAASRIQVTPYAGVWIETHLSLTKRVVTTVTPYAGVWIETLLTGGRTGATGGHPLRGGVD